MGNYNTQENVIVFQKLLRLWYTSYSRKTLKLVQAIFNIHYLSNTN